MKFILCIFFLIFTKFLYGIDYFLDKNSKIDSNEPIIKSVIYFGLQGNTIYLCSKNIELANKLNDLIILFLQKDIKYAFECERTKVAQNTVLINFKY